MQYRPQNLRKQTYILFLLSILVSSVKVTETYQPGLTQPTSDCSSRNKIANNPQGGSTVVLICLLTISPLLLVKWYRAYNCKTDNPYCKGNLAHCNTLGACT